MSNAMGVLIVTVAYGLYLMLGVWKQFPVGYLDWNDPYFHYAVLETGLKALPGFALPVIIAVWAGMVWYRKSMTGEA